LIGVDRKWPADRQTDANDPFETLRRSLAMSGLRGEPEVVGRRPDFRAYLMGNTAEQTFESFPTGTDLLAY
jgi:hypothetical protein